MNNFSIESVQDIAAANSKDADLKKLFEFFENSIKDQIMYQAERGSFDATIEFNRELFFPKVDKYGNIPNTEINFYQELCKKFKEFNCKYQLVFDDRCKCESIIFNLSW